MTQERNIKLYLNVAILSLPIINTGPGQRDQVSVQQEAGDDSQIKR